MATVNIAWAIIGAIRDCRKMDKNDRWAEIERNLNIAVRNIKCAVINVVLFIILKICG